MSGAIVLHNDTFNHCTHFYTIFDGTAGTTSFLSSHPSVPVREAPEIPWWTISLLSQDHTCGDDSKEPATVFMKRDSANKSSNSETCITDHRISSEKM